MDSTNGRADIASRSPLRDALHMNKELLKLITKEAGKDVATIVAKTDEAARTRSELRHAENSFDEKINAMSQRLREANTDGIETAALAGAVGFGIGGATAYLLHDQVSAYFGKGSWPALMVLPSAGIATIAVTPSVFKDKKSQPGENAAMRSAAYGGGVGLLTISAWLSYQDYSAKP